MARYKIRNVEYGTEESGEYHGDKQQTLEWFSASFGEGYLISVEDWTDWASARNIRDPESKPYLY